MTIKELFEKLGVDPEDPDGINLGACYRLQVNGYDKTIKDVPILDFEVGSLTVSVENAPMTEITIYI